MFSPYTDDNGDIHYFDLHQVMDDVIHDMRNSRPPRRDDRRRGPGRRRRRRGPRRDPDIILHQPGPVGPPMYGRPIPYYGPAYPPPPVMPAPEPAREGLDMRGALDALGALLPATGKMIAAFSKPPERPTLTGQPDKDLSAVLEYVGDNFDHARTGAQTAGVLATAGAVLEIVAAL